MTDGNDNRTVEFYLADFRFDDNAEDYIINDWTLVDLKTTWMRLKHLNLH